jgi:hypothetical protein
MGYLSSGSLETGRFARDRDLGDPIITPQHRLFQNFVLTISWSGHNFVVNFVVQTGTGTLRKV